jgi:hypothetical protein
MLENIRNRAAFNELASLDHGNVVADGIEIVADEEIDEAGFLLHRHCLRPTAGTVWA